MLKLAAALIAGLTAMGGWAVVTVKDLPEYVVAGRQYTLEFQVRQHGRTLLNGLHPRLEMRNTQRDLGSVAAVPKRQEDGTYTVTFTAPVADRLVLTLQSGFGNSELHLYPVAVVASGAARPPMALAERGQALFVAKGCNTCHANSDLSSRPDNTRQYISAADLLAPYAFLGANRALSDTGRTSGSPYENHMKPASYLFCLRASV